MAMALAAIDQHCTNGSLFGILDVVEFREAVLLGEDASSVFGGNAFGIAVHDMGCNESAFYIAPAAFDGSGSGVGFRDMGSFKQIRRDFDRLKSVEEESGFGPFGKSEGEEKSECDSGN